MWRVIKTKYRLRLTELTQRDKLSKLQFEMLVREACSAVTARAMKRQLERNRDYIEEFLQ